MQSTVTLELYEYNDLYLKAIQHDDLKEENEKLKEELTNTLKQLEVVKQPKDDTPTYTVKLDGSEVYEAVKEAADEVMKELEKEELQQLKDDTPIREVRMGDLKIAESMEEFKKKLRAEYPESITLCDKDNPEKKVVFNSKGIHLYEGDTLTSFKSI